MYLLSQQILLLRYQASLNQKNIYYRDSYCITNLFFNGISYYSTRMDIYIYIPDTISFCCVNYDSVYCILFVDEHSKALEDPDMGIGMFLCGICTSSLYHSL